MPARKRHLLLRHRIRHIVNCIIVGLIFISAIGANILPQIISVWQKIMREADKPQSEKQKYFEQLEKDNERKD